MNRTDWVKIGHTSAGAGAALLSLAITNALFGGLLTEHGFWVCIEGGLLGFCIFMICPEYDDRPAPMPQYERGP